MADKSVSVDIDLQRQRIDVVRNEKLSELAAQDAACASRFAVTDCLNKVGVRRREILADLKRQEVRLNEADRIQKGVDQLRRSQDKALEAAQRRSEAQAIFPGDTQEGRQRVLDEKILNHKKSAKATATSAPANRAAPGPDDPHLKKNREAYAEKQRAADQRRLERENRLLDKVRDSAPLPRIP